MAQKAIIGFCLKQYHQYCEKQISSFPETPTDDFYLRSPDRCQPCTLLGRKQTDKDTILHLDTAELCHQVPKSNSNVKLAAKTGSDQRALLYYNHTQKLAEPSPLQKVGVLLGYILKSSYKLPSRKMGHAQRGRSFYSAELFDGYG